MEDDKVIFPLKLSDRIIVSEIEKRKTFGTTIIEFFFPEGFKNFRCGKIFLYVSARKIDLDLLDEQYRWLEWTFNTPEIKDVLNKISNNTLTDYPSHDYDSEFFHLLKNNA